MWRYTLADLHPGDDPETWARVLAAEWWRLWIPGNDGADTVIGGQRVRRYSLRCWTGSDPEPEDLPWDRPPTPPRARGRVDRPTTGAG